MVLASCVLNNQGQLPGRNRSRAKNDGDHRCEKCAFDGLSHDSSFLSVVWLKIKKMNTMSYFVGCAPVGCVEQNPVVDSRGKAQMQPLLHGWPALQLPPQAKPTGSLRNCRAESVPEPRTAMTRVEKSIVLMVLCIHGSPSYNVWTIFLASLVIGPVRGETPNKIRWCSRRPVKRRHKGRGTP